MIGAISFAAVSLATLVWRESLGAICAYLLGLKRWMPDHDRLMTMVEWQGGPQQSWIPFYKPVMAEYEPYHVSNEIMLFVLALLVILWGWWQRNHKIDGRGARILMGLGAAGAVYLLMLWTARQHVEGDWKAAPPRLWKREIDTPEFLEKEAAQKAEWDAFELKRTGLTRAQRDAEWEKLSNKMLTIFILFVTACAFGANA